jgi:hypothetical protein
MIALPPSNIVLQTGNQLNYLSWDIVVGATSFSIYRSTDGINFSSIGTSSTNSYTDTLVTVGIQYYYQVASVNSSGTSPFSQPYPLSITPCLPGQINLGYLRYQSQLRADKLNSQYLTTDEWNFNINQSANELYDILVDKNGENYFFAPPLLMDLTGVISYPFPDGSNYPINGLTPPNAPALYKLSGVDSNISGGGNGPNAGWVPLPRMNWSDRDRFTTWPGQAGALNNIYQMSYREMGNQLYLFPQNINILIRVWYVPMLTQMLYDTDMLSFSISGWSEFVIIDAAMKAMIKEQSTEKWQALAQTKAGMIERIETTAANRNVDMPNSVSNTRATYGDPGLSYFGNGFGSGGFGGSGGGY